MNNKAFTLIELLVVIAILAVLAVAVTLILNPAELIRQGRDSTRLSDMATIEKAIGLYQVDQPGAWLGTSSIAYISLPDSNSDCSSYNLLGLPDGWSYHCVPSASSTNVDGTGWIPINLTQASFSSPLSKYPIDPVNSATSSLYYTYYAGSYELTANVESTRYLTEEADDGGDLSTMYERGTHFNLAVVPTAGDWITVPGDSTYNTGDFKVMKYEAKCVTSDGEPLTIPTDVVGVGVYNVYDDNATACTSANSRSIAATAKGYPITRISHNKAKVYCQSIGAHLITNDEWMTIARNVEQIDENWTNGSVGSGCLFRGNSGNTTCGYDGPNPDSGNYRNDRASLTLSNGEEIYDLAGNVWEHVKRDSDDTLTSTGEQPDTASPTGSFGWRQFTAISDWDGFTSQMVELSNTSWDTSQGVGAIYHCDGCSDSTADRIFLRGGYLDSSACAGAATLVIYWDAEDWSYGDGFRCAY